MDSDSWARTTAAVDQTVAALKENEYNIMRFQDATREFVGGLRDCGLTRVEMANIIGGMALSVIFPEHA